MQTSPKITNFFARCRQVIFKKWATYDIKITKRDGEIYSSLREAADTQNSLNPMFSTEVVAATNSNEFSLQNFTAQGKSL
jgi:hypothetical protein